MSVIQNISFDTRLRTTIRSNVEYFSHFPKKPLEMGPGWMRTFECYQGDDFTQKIRHIKIPGNERAEMSQVSTQPTKPN